MKDHIVVTGATGNTGQVLAEDLQRLGVPFVAMARSESNRAKLRARGFETVHGDFDDPASMERALEGAQKAYLVCTPDEKLVPRETAFIAAAKKVGVAHIVKCSAYIADVAGETANLRAHGKIERALEDSGLAYTILRPHGFMQTFTLFAWDMIQKAGVVSNPTGDGKLPLIDVRDVARVALKAFTEPGHEGKEYDLTGPEALSGHEQAEILERVLDRPVTFIAADPVQFELIMRILGVPETPREHVVKIMKMTRERRIERVHDTLQQLGIEPTTYEQFLRDMLAGRTGGGNSFEPPNSLVAKAIGAVMPTVMNLRFRLLGRPRRAFRSRGPVPSP